MIHARILGQAQYPTTKRTWKVSHAMWAPSQVLNSLIELMMSLKFIIQDSEYVLLGLDETSKDIVNIMIMLFCTVTILGLVLSELANSVS